MGMGMVCGRADWEKDQRMSLEGFGVSVDLMYVMWVRLHVVAAAMMFPKTLPVVVCDSLWPNCSVICQYCGSQYNRDRRSYYRHSSVLSPKLSQRGSVRIAFAWMSAIAFGTSGIPLNALHRVSIVPLRSLIHGKIHLAYPGINQYA